MKKNTRNILLAALLLGQSQAAPLYWDGGNGNWLSASSWSTDAAATTPDPAAPPTTTDAAIFNISSANTASTIILNGNYAANSLTFNNTAATSLVADGTNRALSVGSGGMTMAVGAGTVTIGSATANQNVVVTYTASQTWLNHSSNNIVLANPFVTSAGVGITKQGTGNVWMNNTANNSAVSGLLDVQAGKLLISGDLAANGGLTGAGTIENGGPSSKWFFVSQNTDTTFSGTIKNNTANPAGIRLGLIKQGTGTLTLSGSNQLGDMLGVDSGRVRITGNTEVGNVGTANADMRLGRVAGQNARILVDGGTLTGYRNAASTIVVGQAGNAQGFLAMTSGTITLANQMSLSNSTAGSFGGYTQTSGALSVGSWLVVGNNLGNGVFNQSGGSVVVTANRMTIAAGGAASTGVVNLSGGTFTNNAGVFVGENGTGYLNISGTASVSLGTGGTAQLAGNGTSLAGAINLLGGTLAANAVTKGPSTAGGIYRFTFNGGKLKATVNNPAFFNDLPITDAYVYPGGGTIDNSGFAIAVTEQLKAPTGNGVSIGTIATTGAGYFDTPIVTVTGGGGTGATAVASVDGSGNLTGITMTNPGIGYTSAPTFALIGGGIGNTGAITGSAAVVANTSGAMIFDGTGTTTLKAIPTYTGGSTVKAGTLELNYSNAASIGAISLANAAKLTLNAPVKGNVFTTTNASFGTTAATTLNMNVGDQAGANISAAMLDVTGTLALNGTVTVNVAGTKFAVGILPLISYSSKSGAGAVTIGTLPSGVVANLIDNGSGLIYLNITQVALPRWNGTVDNLWDTVTTNWVDQVTLTGSMYADPNPVTFDDLASGVGATAVTLNVAVAPKEVIYNNTLAVNYSLTGTGKITGASTLIKKNTGNVSITGIANDFTGITRIEGGVLAIDSLTNGGIASSIGAASAAPANIVLAGGVLSYTGSSTTTDRGFFIDAVNSGVSVTNDLTVTGQINSGALANFLKQGAGTLTIAGLGTNTIGAGGNSNKVQAGTLIFDGTAGAQVNNLVTEVWVGDIPDVPANLTLLNTTVNVATWLATGRGNGDNGLVNLGLTNSTLNVGNFSSGYNNGLAANASEVFISQVNSVFTNTGTTHIAESSGNQTTWVLSGGSSYTAGNTFNIGGVGTALGVVTVKDTSSIVKNNAGQMVIGNGGLGTLNLQDNASLTVGNLDTYVGNGGTSEGTLLIKDSATATFGGPILVGKSSVDGTGSSKGTVNQSGGTVNATTWIVVGRYVGAVGNYNISAGMLNHTATNNTASALIIAEAGKGTMTVSGTGEVKVDGVFASIAKVSTAVGTLQLDGGTFAAKRVVEEAGGGISLLNLNGGVLKASAASADFVNVDTIDAQVGGAIVNSNGFNINIIKAIGGVGGFTKQGAGVLSLDGALTYAGDTIVNGGTLAIGAAALLPATTNLTVDGATLDARNSYGDRELLVEKLTLNNATVAVAFNGVDSDHVVAMNTVTATGTNTFKLLSTPATGSYTLLSTSAPLTGTFAIDTTALPNGFKTYTGAISGNNYVLTVTGAVTPLIAYWKGDVSSQWNDASLAPNSNWATNAGGATDTAQTPDSVSDVYFSATGATNTATILGTDTQINSLTFSSGTASIGGTNQLTLLGTNANNQALEVMPGASASIALTTLTYTGNTLINAGGSLAVSGGTLGDVIGGLQVEGTLKVDSNLTKGELSGSGLLTRSIVGVGLLKIGGGYDSLFSGVIENGAGSVILTKVGTNSLTLSGANTYTGGTNLQAGTLVLANASAVGTGVLTLSGGLLDNGFGAALAVNCPVSLGGAFAFVGTDDLTLSGAMISTSAPTIDVVAKTFTLDGTVTGNFGLTKNGLGKLVVNGTITSGNTNAAGVLNFANGVTDLNGTLTSTGAELWIGNAAGKSGTLNVSTGDVINATNWLAIGRDSANGILNMTGGTITKTTTNGNITLAGVGGAQTAIINQSGGQIINTASSTMIGENGIGIYNLSTTAEADLGVLSLGIVNVITANGTVNLNGGALLRVKQVNKPGAAATATMNFNGGTLKANTAATAATFLQGLSRANVRDGGAVIDTNSQDVTIAQALLHSNLGGDNAVDGGLTKNGAGKLTLTGANSYTGNTTVNTGTLSLSQANLDDASVVTIATGATLDLTHATADVVATLVINGATMADGTYGATGSGAPIENAAITGTGRIQVGSNPYDTWAAAKGLTGADALAAADPDQDGMSNLLEYFLDGNPKAFTARPAIAADGSTLSISFKRRDDAEADVAAQFVRVSTDLMNWTDVAIPAASGTVGVITFTIQENGAAPDDITATVAKGTDVKKFLGVKITE